jgi:hypothetical protein
VDSTSFECLLQGPERHSNPILSAQKRAHYSLPIPLDFSIKHNTALEESATLKISASALPNSAVESSHSLFFSLRYHEATIYNLLRSLSCF